MNRARPAFGEVMQALLAFALRPQNAHGLEQASQEYFGASRLEEVEVRDVDYLAFLEWFTFDRPTPEGHASLVDSFIEVTGAFSGRQRADVSSWSGARVSFYRVLRSYDGGVLVADIVSPEACDSQFVHDPPTPQPLSPGDVVMARILPWHGRLYFGGALSVFARSAHASLLEFLGVLRSRLWHGEWDTVLREALPLLARSQRATEAEQESLFPGGYPECLTTETLETLVAQGRRALGLGAWAEALRHFQRVLFEKPLDAVALNGVGLAYMGRGDLVRARTAFASILARDPHCAMALLNLGNLELCTGEVERALDLLEQARRFSADESSRIQAFFNLGVAHLERGESPVARRCFREASRRAEAQARGEDPDVQELYQLHLRVASVLSSRSEWRAATPYLEKIVQQSPDSGTAHLCLAQAHFEQGHHVLAARAFRRALSLDAGGGRAWNSLGRCYMKLGRWRLAEDAFRHAIDLLPGLADAHENLGRAIMEQNRLEEARIRFETALRHAPSSVDVLVGTGEVYRRMRDYKASLRYLRRAVRVAPDHVAARCLLQQVKKERSLCT